MLAYVMNMDRAPLRMARMAQMLDHLEIPHVRVPALDGTKITKPAGVPISSAYYGSFMTHVRCWEMIAEGTEPAGLCLEDDVVFANNFPTLWRDPRLTSIADVIKFEGSPFEKVSLGARKDRLAGGYDVYPLLSPLMGAAAYLVTKAGAKWLLRNAKPIKNLDTIIFGDLLYRDLEFVVTSPAACIQYCVLPELPEHPELSKSTLAYTPSDRRQLTIVNRIENAALKFRRKMTIALYTKSRNCIPLHPSGPLVL